MTANELPWFNPSGKDSISETNQEQTPIQDNHPASDSEPIAPPVCPEDAHWFYHLNPSTIDSEADQVLVDLTHPASNVYFHKIQAQTEDQAMIENEFGNCLLFDSGNPVHSV